MGHFAGLSGPSSRWREEAVTAAACWLLAAVFGWGMRWCRAEESEKDCISNSPQGSVPGGRGWVGGRGGKADPNCYLILPCQ